MHKNTETSWRRQVSRIKLLFLGIVLGLFVGTPLGVYGHAYLPSLTKEWTVRADFLWRAEVIKVADGDTLEVSTWLGNKRTIRLVGINTPETVDPRRPEQCYGKEASAESKRLLSGTKVSLTLDEVAGVFDDYHRVLAYVTLKDGSMLNQHLVERGFAWEFTYRNQKYFHQDDFRRAEREAKAEKRGLWGVCPPRK